MDQYTSGPSLEEIQHWKVSALKDFLRIRGLKTTGRKAELQALVYSTVQLGLAVKPDELEEERTRSLQYAALLQYGGTRLPDPLVDLSDDSWLNEKEGVKHWPPVSYFEIAEWLLCEAPCTSNPSISTKKEHNRPASLHKRLLTDYKEGKAYSYFDSKWLHEIFYNPITTDNDICFVKSKCTPSQSINNVPHTVWVALQKKSGKICSAYCSCFAGLGSTCNHVAAVIFKLDNAFMHGVSRSNLPCTSKVCQWNVYDGGSTSVLDAKPVCEMEWAKPSYSKGENKTPINTVAKRLFDPLHNTRKPPEQQGLLSALYPSCNESSIFKYLFHETKSPENFPLESHFNLETTIEVETDCETPPCLSEIANERHSVEEFMTSVIEYNSAQIASIEMNTRGQSDNAQWAHFRSGMITASNFKAVVSRHTTLSDKNTNRSQNPVPIIKKIMGYEPLDPNMPNLKYGRLMEPKARNEYNKLQEEKGHKNLKVVESGLFVHPQKIFVGASPDALVHCSCCGDGLLEIKCPRSIAGEEPTGGNVEALMISDDGKTKMKENHAYYYQVQTQMGVTGRKWCDFFVYTSVGFYIQRVNFNEELWENAFIVAVQFFEKYIAPELVHREIQKSIASRENEPSTSGHVSCSQINVTENIGQPPKKKDKTRGKSKKNPKVRGSLPVYLCGICSQICKFEPENISEQSIGCDNCSGWFHWVCQKITNTPVGSWYCRGCRRS